ncbi:MAG: hypothetical protein LBP95_14045 [Deltaproteobacteria bacterium]|nr:hypothetical protein [Deltaproteobacteria bacterium]
MFLGSLFNFLFNLFNSVSHRLYQLLKGPASGYCRLETSDDETTLVADDGSLVSVLGVTGALAMVPEEDLGGAVALLAEKTRTLLERPGHHLTMNFAYDPAAARGELAENFRPSRVSAGECGLDLGSVLDGWERALVQKCGGESFQLAYWTTPELLPEKERAAAVRGTMAGLPGRQDGRQTEGRAVAALRAAHKGAGEALRRALSSAGFSAETLPWRTVVNLIKRGLDPSLAHRDFAPVGPGDKRPLQEPDQGLGEAARLMYPSLGSQIFSSDCRMVGGSMVLAGGRLHAPFFMSVPPRAPRPFSELFRALSAGGPGDPLRMCFSLSPDGLGSLGGRPFLARLLQSVSKDNRALVAAADELRALADAGETVVAFSMAFDTHVDLADFPGLDAAVQFLRGRLSRVARLVAGWGQGQVAECSGDPLLGVCAVLPAMAPRGGPAPRAAAPLSEAWSFWPLRPASPWGRGPLVLRSPDGKIMPYAPNSSVQSAWIDLGLAPMGGGKSVLLNTLNLAFCLQPGLAGLPYLSIIDVGPSSSGLVSLLKNALPARSRHLVVHHRLKMTPEESVNPFDTPLGCRTPLPSHLGFLVNFLCLLCTPLDGTAPPAGADGVLRAAVTSAYLELADKPRPLGRAADPELFESALRLGFPLDDLSTWWELTDFFFELGETRLAALAQRQASPVLGDVSAQVRNNPGLAAVYKFRVAGTGEMILDYVHRCLTEAHANYRFLCRPTRFPLTEARVVSLDLDEVAPRGGGAAGDRQTAVMYMLARFLVGGKFFLSPSDVPLMPERYRGHHGRLVSEMRRVPKRLCYDELHRVTGLKAVGDQLVGDLETSARESRKWNLSLGLYSQSWADIPKVILELATTVFILGSGTRAGRRELALTFGLTPALESALEFLGKPGPDGAGLVALFRTGEGTSKQFLTNTISPELLCAFSSTAEDMFVRDSLYETEGVRATLAAMAALHPAGVKGEVERRAASRAAGNPASGRLDVQSEIVSEIRGFVARKRGLEAGSGQRAQSENYRRPGASGDGSRTTSGAARAV